MAAPNIPPTNEAEKAARRFASLGERETVEHGCLGRRGTWDAHQNGGKRVGRWDHRHHAHEHGERRRDVHAVDEGQQKRHAGDAPEGGKDADDETDRHSDQHVEEVVQGEQVGEGAEKGFLDHCRGLVMAALRLTQQQEAPPPMVDGGPLSRFEAIA
jgi:hypothetical protein